MTEIGIVPAVVLNRLEDAEPLAEALGGIELLKALAGPFRHTGIGFVPTNGITLDNLADYISLPYVRACGGPWFAPADLIESGQLDEIKERNRKAVEVVKKTRSQQA